MSRIPDGAAVKDLAERLKAGGWKLYLHLNCADAHRYFYRSFFDPRVTALKVSPKKGKPRIVSYTFTPVAYRPFAEEAEAPHFETLEALASALIRHDRDEAEEREWNAADPSRRASPAPQGEGTILFAPSKEGGKSNTGGDR